MLGELWSQFGLTQALFLTLLTVILLYFIYGRGKRYNFPPGPTPLPLIGNIIMFSRSKKSTPLLLRDLAREYGPIYSVSFGMSRAVVLNNFELAKEALLTKPTTFAGRPKSYTTEMLTEGGKDIIRSDYGPTWRLQRKIASKALKTYLSGQELEKRVHKATKGALDVIALEKGPFNPREHLSFLIMNFISAFCFGVVYDFKDPKLINLVDLFDTFLEKAANGLPEDIVPALRHLHLKRSTEVLGVVKNFQSQLYQQYEEHEKVFDADNIRDFTDCLIAAQKEAQAEEAPTELAKLTKTHFVQTLSDIFGAGFDSSRYTLSWAILHMVANPDIQEKVYKEIEQVVGTTRLPGMDDRKQLRYTEATLFESMRMGTVGPMGSPHTALEDGQIGGYDVPKGTMVIINHLTLHYDPTFWGDPEVFRPERFLEADGTPAPKPQNFFPFSMGRRVCLGEAVAKPETLLIFASLIQKFKFSVPPGDKINLEPSGGMNGFAPHPFKVVAECRN